MNDPVSLPELLTRSTPENRIARCARGRDVYGSGDLRWLCSPPGAVQSALDLANPRRPVLANHLAMTLTAALPPRVERILDLGTGCGALLRFARSALPGAEVTGVEQDPAMLEIARTHFALPPDEAVIVASARDYLESRRGAWDLVFSDLFDGVREPDWLLSEAFCRALSAALTPNGVAALNLLPVEKERLETQLRTARRYFPGTGLLRAGDQDNVVLVLASSPLDKQRWEQRLRGGAGFDFGSSAQAIFGSLRVFS
ncbi:MAG: fused MFS/spermidine synthase [Pseudomonadota bacterium]